MGLSQLWNRLRTEFGTSRTGSGTHHSRYSKRGTRYRTSADISQQGQSLEQRLMLTSDLTEILQFDSLSLTPNDVLEIEIGGTERGNPAGGNDTDGFDQIMVTGFTPVQLDGLLEVRLVNDYLPAIGTSFRFLSIPPSVSMTGGFSSAFGLYSFPSNDRYFDVTTDSEGLLLEVKALPDGLRFSPPDSQRDAFGRFLSSYFDNTATNFSCTGSISVNGFATVSGTLAFEQTAGETRVVGSGINVALNQDTTGVAITDAAFGLVVTNSNTYAFEATGTAVLHGLSGFSMSGSLYAERSTIPTDVSRTVNVNGQSVSIDVAANARRFAGEDIVFSIAGFAAIDGDFAFDVSGTSVTAVATGVSASMQASMNGCESIFLLAALPSSSSGAMPVQAMSEYLLA